LIRVRVRVKVGVGVGIKGSLYVLVNGADGLDGHIDFLQNAVETSSLPFTRVEVLH